VRFSADEVRPPDDRALQKAVLDVVRRFLTAGIFEAVDLTEGGGSEAWAGDVSDILDRIRNEWNARGGPPNIHHMPWLRPTPTGRALASMIDAGRPSVMTTRERRVRKDAVSLRRSRKVGFASIVLDALLLEGSVAFHLFRYRWYFVIFVLLVLLIGAGALVFVRRLERGRGSLSKYAEVEMRFQKPAIFVALALGLLILMLRAAHRCVRSAP